MPMNPYIIIPSINAHFPLPLNLYVINNQNLNSVVEQSNPHVWSSCQPIPVSYRKPIIAYIVLKTVPGSIWRLSSMASLHKDL